MLEALRVTSTSRLDLDMPAPPPRTNRIDKQVPHRMPHDFAKPRSQPFNRQDSIRSQSSSHGHTPDCRVDHRMSIVENQLSALARSVERLSSKFDTIVQASLVHSQSYVSQQSYKSQGGQSSEGELVLQEGADPDLAAAGHVEPERSDDGKITPRTLQAFTSSVPNRNRSRTGSSLNLIVEDTQVS